MELFERVGMDRLRMAFCDWAIDLLALMDCENMGAGGINESSN